MPKKILIIGIGLLAIPSFVLAQTVDEISAGLKSVIEELSNIASQMPVTQDFCYDFDSVLAAGFEGEQVLALQIVLGKEGFAVDSSEMKGSFFGQSTEAALRSFQEKYSSDILAPEYSAGTGEVGSKTRAKLNSLYSCGDGAVQAPQILGAYSGGDRSEIEKLALIIELVSEVIEKIGNIFGR